MDHTYFFYEGLCNLELTKYSAAEENFKKDISIQTGGDKAKESGAHYNSLLYLGIVYYEMKEDERSKAYLMECLAYYKELPEANYYLAMVNKRENNAELREQYLEIAKRSEAKGYRLNEDNLYYANYPHQVTLFEIEKELAK